ncbi:MAG: DUF4962 domain-containing protein, partial [Myxococcales bacterium]
MLLALAATLALVAAPHPSLFFNANDVALLRGATDAGHADIKSHFVKLLAPHVNDLAPAQNEYGAGGERLFGNDIVAWSFAYQLTGDSAYAAQAWTRLSTYLSWTDWGFGVEFAGQPDLFTAHMVLGVACAYDWLYEYLTPDQRLQVRTRLGTEAQKIAAYYPTAWWLREYIQNHNWIDTGAMGLAGLALQGEDSRAGGWISKAQSNLANVQLTVGPINDGSWHEGLAYQQYGLSMGLPFWMASRRAGVDYTDTGLLRGVGSMYLAAMIPDAPRTQILPYGDFTGWPREGVLEILRYAAARFHDGVAQAAANRWLAAGSRTSFIPDLFYDTFEFLGYDPTVAAVDPHTRPLDTQLSDLQATVLHSSWDKGDLVLAFKAGPYGGRANFDRLKAGGLPGEIFPWGHSHNDDMSFWLYGGGTWLAPEAAGYDAGRRPSPEPVGSVYANETQYHNGLLIDGKGELGDQRLSDSASGNPWFYKRDATLLPSASTADYAVTGGSGPNLYDASLGLQRWDRVLVLARKRYTLVHDDIAASSPHDYDWLVHFSDGAVADGTGWIKGTTKNAALTLGVRMVSPASWTIATG